jgi:SAM-dependent methyltransferase
VFLTSLADIRFWIRSARTDALLRRFRNKGHAEQQVFDLLYEERGDPWGLSSPQFRYQQAKYDTMLSLLPDRRYKRALDLGSGLGDLTRRLSRVAEEVVGIDMSQVAIERAHQKTAGLCNVEFQQGDVLNLGHDLDRSFDLVVVADTLYYLSPLSVEVLRDARERATRLLAPGGILLLVNHFIGMLNPGSRWTPGIHNSFRSASDLAVIGEHRRFFYLVGIFEKIET